VSSLAFLTEVPGHSELAVTTTPFGRAGVLQVLDTCVDYFRSKITAISIPAVRRIL
jgi:hypothetical protein